MAAGNPKTLREIYLCLLLEKPMVTAMNKHFTTLSFFLLAVLLYFVGMALPAVIFLFLGMLAEIVFWVRLFRGNKNEPSL